MNLTRNLSRSDISVENCLGNSINSLKELQNSITSIPSFLVSTQHLLLPKSDHKDDTQEDQDSQGCRSRKSSSITSSSTMGYAKPWLLERDPSFESYASFPSHGNSRRSSHCPSIITAEQFEVDHHPRNYNHHYIQQQNHHC